MSSCNIGIYVQPRTGDVQVTGNVLPSSCNVYDLGSAAARWRDLYLSGNTIDLGGTKISRDASTGGLRLESAAGGGTVDSRVRNLVADGTIQGSNLISCNVSINTNGTGTSLLVVQETKGQGVVDIRATRDWQSTPSSVFYITNNGSVGIGTTSPQTTLDVRGMTSLNRGLQVSNPGDTIQSLRVTGNWYGIAEFMDSSSVTALKVSANRNVGIGTTIPTESLHVQGNIKASGTISASNLSIIGDFVTLNTVTSNTEQVVVTNAGTGPALKVTQTGANSIAEFYDDGGVLALKVADGGNVGIGTATPLYNLDIRKSLSVGSNNTYVTTSYQYESLAQSSTSRSNMGFIQTPWVYSSVIESPPQKGPGTTLITIGDAGGSLSALYGNVGTGVNNITMVTAGYERLRIDTNGNVGIGTNPIQTLHVNGAIMSGSRVDVHQAGSGGGQNRFTGLDGPTTANGRAQLVLSSAYSDLVIASSQGNNAHGSTLTFATYDPTNAATYRKFVINQGNWGTRKQFLDFGYTDSAYTNPHDYIYSTHVFMSLDGINKRLGIGTMDPQKHLHINSAAGETNVRISCTSTNGKAYEIISGGTEGAFAGGRFGVYSKTDGVELISMTSSTGAIAGGTAGRAVGFGHAGMWIDRTWSDYPSITVTNNNNAGNTNQSQLRIHGTNSSYSSYPNASGADFSCSLYIDGTYQSSSDRRFKTNITTISGALEKVMSLSGKRYQVKSSTGQIQTRISENDYKFGFIAQDVQAAGLDELYVHYKEEDDGTDGYNRAYALDYLGVIPLLVNAIKEQQEQINSLKTEIAKLQA